MDAASGEHGVVLTLRRRIGAMLRSRTIRVEIGGGSVTVLVNRGLPQGGVLSPLLWNMVVDGLFRRLFNAHYQEQDYADDDGVVLLQKGKFVSTFLDRMQGALNCAEHWCSEIGLSVNADKTTMVLFTNNRKIGNVYNRKFFGTKLRMTDQVKYQGEA
jgi:hypothetical protein